MLGKPYRRVAEWAAKIGLHFMSGHDMRWTMQRKREFQRAPWERIPWGCTNAQIARAYGVSREIVRRRRKEYTQPISP